MMYVTLHLMYLPYVGSWDIHVVTFYLCCYSSLCVFPYIYVIDVVTLFYKVSQT
jgi:hypothetical protein